MPITATTAALIAAGISAAAGTAGSIATNRTNRINVEKTNEMRRQEYLRNMNYNSETAQMQRRMSAGLHPMTMAGSQPSEAPTAPDYESYEMRNPFGGAIDTGQTLAQTFLESKRFQIQDKSLEVDQLATQSKIAEIVGNLADRGFTSDEITNLFHRLNILDQDKSIDDIQAGNFNLSLLKSRLDQTGLANKLSQKELDWFDDMQRSILDLQASNVSLNKVKEDTERSLQSLNEAKRREAYQAISNMKQQLLLLEQQTTIASYDANKALSSMKYIREDTDKLHQILVSDADLSKKQANWFIAQLIMSTVSSFVPNVGFIGKL